MTNKKSQRVIAAGCELFLCSRCDVDGAGGEFDPGHFFVLKIASSSLRNPILLPVPRCTLSSSKHSQMPLTTVTFLRSSVSSHSRGCPKPQGQQRGNCNSSQFQMRTLRYSLRRVSPLDSVN